MKKIKSVEELCTLYGEPAKASLWKELSYLSPHYQAFIHKAPFLILSTYGEKGVDCSPRGDPAGFVQVVDEKTLHIPDRRGNNRLDSLKNIVANKNVGIIFLIPGVGETLRVAGTAEIIVDEALCESFSVNGKAASSVIEVFVEKAFVQCPKALKRSSLWENEAKLVRSELPSLGEMLQYCAEKNNAEFSAEDYDKAYPERVKKTMY